MLDSQNQINCVRLKIKEKHGTDNMVSINIGPVPGGNLPYKGWRDV